MWSTRKVCCLFLTGGAANGHVPRRGENSDIACLQRQDRFYNSLPETLRRELLRQLSTVAAHLPHGFPAGAMEEGELVSHVVDIGGIDQESVLSVRHEVVTRPGGLADDDGQPCRAGLVHHRPPLFLQSRMNKRTRHAVPRGHLRVRRESRQMYTPIEVGSRYFLQDDLELRSFPTDYEVPGICRTFDLVHIPLVPTNQAQDIFSLDQARHHNEIRAVRNFRERPPCFDRLAPRPIGAGFEVRVVHDIVSGEYPVARDSKRLRVLSVDSAADERRFEMPHVQRRLEPLLEPGPPFVIQFAFAHQYDGNRLFSAPRNALPAYFERPAGKKNHIRPDSLQALVDALRADCRNLSARGGMAVTLGLHRDYRNVSARLYRTPWMIERTACYLDTHGTPAPSCTCVQRRRQARVVIVADVDEQYCNIH